MHEDLVFSRCRERILSVTSNLITKTRSFDSSVCVTDLPLLDTDTGIAES